jgi:hypothetical protein
MAHNENGLTLPITFANTRLRGRPPKPNLKSNVSAKTDARFRSKGEKSPGIRA